MEKKSISFWEDVRNTSPSAVAYLINKTRSMLILMVISAYYFSSEENILEVLVKVTVGFLIVSISILLGLSVLSSRHQMEKNILLGLISVILSLIGLLSAVWLKIDYAANGLDIGTILIIIIVCLLAPMLDYLMGPSLHIKSYKLHHFGLLQIIIIIYIELGLIM